MHPRARAFEAVKRSVDDRGRFFTVALRGDLSAHHCATLDAFFQQIGLEGALLVAVDCSGLESISSAGVGVFIGFQEKLREIGGRLILTRVTPNVREVFELLGLGGFLAVEDDRP